MHKVTKSLQKFYDSEANKFSGTRKRHWPEFAYIRDMIKEVFPEKKTLRILELGCGDGRLLGYLQEELSVSCEYTGVDISYNLLEKANTEHPEARRVHQDMVSFLQTCKPETYDCIILVASFHHLPTVTHRINTLAGIYASLLYDGLVVMTNRCYSDRFKKQYSKEIRNAQIKSLLSLGYYNRHDIMVPWKNNAGELISDRLYHIFSQGELAKLIIGAGFSQLKQIYMEQSGDIGYKESDGRNLVTSMRKSIYE